MRQKVRCPRSLSREPGRLPYPKRIGEIPNTFEKMGMVIVLLVDQGDFGHQSLQDMFPVMTGPENLLKQQADLSGCGTKGLEKIAKSAHKSKLFNITEVMFFHD